MKLFGRTGGYYLFWTGAIYLSVGMYCIFVNNFVPVWVAQVLWIGMLVLPFVIPPFGRWLNMSIDWDIKMFNWFKKQDYSNVVPMFPDQVPFKESSPMFPDQVPFKESSPYVEPTAPKEKDPTTYYEIGHTTDNRVSLKMGYTTLTMNSQGVQNLIDQLELYQSQLCEEDPE